MKCSSNVHDLTTSPVYRWLVVVGCLLGMGLAIPAVGQDEKAREGSSLLDLSNLFDSSKDQTEQKSAAKSKDVPQDVLKAGAKRPVGNFGSLPPVITKVQAFAGRPYGIGKIEYRLRPGDEMIDRSGAALLTEKNGRVRYPVTSKPPPSSATSSPSLASTSRSTSCLSSFCGLIG